MQHCFVVHNPWHFLPLLEDYHIGNDFQFVLRPERIYSVLTWVMHTLGKTRIFRFASLLVLATTTDLCTIRNLAAVTSTKQSDCRNKRNTIYIIWHETFGVSNLFGTFRDDILVYSLTSFVDNQADFNNLTCQLSRHELYRLEGELQTFLALIHMEYTYHVLILLQTLFDKNCSKESCLRGIYEIQKQCDFPVDLCDIIMVYLITWKIVFHSLALGVSLV